MTDNEGKNPRGHMKGFRPVYDWKKGQPHIGDFSFYRKTYLTDPVVQTNINIPCRYVWKSGWYIQGAHKEAVKVVREYLDKVGIDHKGFIFAKDSKVFGTGYMEYTHDDLYIRNPDTMFVRVDNRGRIRGWEQRVSSRNEPIRFAKNEIIFMANNPFSDSIYGVSDIEAVRYVVRYLKDQAERDVGAMLNKYVGERFIVTGGTPEQPYQEPELKKMRDFLSVILFGEDIVVGGDVKVDTIASSGQAMDFRAYLDYIIMILSIGMNVPIVFWEGKSSTNATATVQLRVFESYVKFLQTQIEDAFNTQLIPNIIEDYIGDSVDRSEYPKFVFKPINSDDEFTKAKTQSVWLQNGVVSPDEIRQEVGFIETDQSVDRTGATAPQNISGNTGKPDLEKETKKQTGLPPGSGEVRE